MCNNTKTIGILAAIAVPSYQQYVLKSRYANVISAGDAFAKLVNSWQQETASTNLNGFPGSFTPPKHH